MRLRFLFAMLAFALPVSAQEPTGDPTPPATSASAAPSAEPPPVASSAAPIASAPPSATHPAPPPPPPPTAAQPPPDPDKDKDDEKSVFFGIGPMIATGFAAGVDYNVSGQAAAAGIPAPEGLGPGFGGPYGSFGAMADLRIKFFGVEVDYLRTAVKVDAPVALPIAIGVTPNVKFSQWDNQLAIIGKLALPVPLIGPLFGAGVTFVFPETASVAVDPTVPGVTFKTTTGSGAKPNEVNWTYFTAVAGAEVKLPLGSLDIRIPVMMRFNWNVTSGTCKADLAAGDPPCNLTAEAVIGPPPSLTLTYNTAWKYQVGVTVAVAIYF